MSVRKTKRITISFSQIVYDMAVESMELKGFTGNLSASLADLVRRDKEKFEAQQPAQPLPQPPPPGTDTQIVHATLNQEIQKKAANKRKAP